MTERIAFEKVSLTFPVLGGLRRADAPRYSSGQFDILSRGLLGVTALQDISFSANDGDRIGVIGRNGSGKTTLLRVLAGIYPPQKGVVTVRGKISSMLDIFGGFDPDASGSDNIEIRGLFLGADRSVMRKLRDEIIDFSGLGSFIDLPVRTYSAGMKMRLVFSVATSLEPEILIMDEWLSAGDADFRAKAETRMTELVSKSRVLVIASHSGGLLARTCTKGMVLEEGKISYLGDIKDAIALAKLTG